MYIYTHIYIHTYIYTYICGVDAPPLSSRTGGADTVSNATAALANLAERNDGNKSLIGSTPRCIATLFRFQTRAERV